MIRNRMIIQISYFALSRSQSKNLLSDIHVRVKSKIFGDRAFENMAPKLWNSLPQNIRSITDFDKFKSMLKTHLFDNY